MASCPQCFIGQLVEKVVVEPYKCSGCRVKGIGPAVGCNHCDYVLHRQCRFPSEKLTPAFLPSCIFTFKVPPPPPKIQCSKCDGDIYCDECHRCCDACGKAVHGFVYHCPTPKSDIDLHPCCATLPTQFLTEGVEFKLSNESKSNKCDWCMSKYVQGNDDKIPGWFYESENKEYNYHVHCIMDMGHMALMAVKSCPTGSGSSGGGGGDYNLALENLVLPSKVVKRKTGKNGDKYRKTLKTFITMVLSFVFGDPTTILFSLSLQAVGYLLGVSKFNGYPEPEPEPV